MKTLPVIALYFFAIQASADHPGTHIDSLVSSLSRAPRDTNRVKILVKLSEVFVTSEPSKALAYATEAYDLAQQLKFRHGELESLTRLTDYEYRQSNYAHAVQVGMDALKIANELDDPTATANIYRLLGLINTFGLKEYEKALDYDLKALTIYKRQNDKAKIAAQYGSITWIYAIVNKNIEEAHELASQGIAMARALGDHQIASYNYNSRGILFFRQRKFDSAVVNLQRSNDYAARDSDIAVIAYNNSLLGCIYERQHQYEPALKYFNQSLEQSRKLNLREVLKDSYEGLAKSYNGLGQYKLAFDFNILYEQLEDSLLNWETTQKALMIQQEYEKERREAKIAQLQLEKDMAEEEKSIFMWLFAGGVVTLLLIIFLIMRNSKNKQKANQLLKEKNEEIELQNAKLQHVNDTKDKLFSIIGHDLRSPISNLKGLLSLVATDVVSADELKEFTPKINQNVSHVHEMLENLLLWSYTQMRGFKHDPKQTPLHPIVGGTIGLLSDSAKDKRIEISNSVPEHITAYVDENHARLIFRNLINNAIKFTATGGKVNIGAEDGPAHITVVVNDTGVGIPKERISTLFDTQTHFTTLGTSGEKGTGLGLHLCKEMVEANKGKIRVESEPGKGSSFYVALKRQP